MDDETFLHAFLHGAPPGRFGHREHLRAAWTALRLYGPQHGADLVAEGIRRFASAHGQAERYHETITRFWLRLVWHAMSAAPDVDDFEVFLSRFPLLLDGSLLGRHWTRETLESGRARWREPDLLPLP
jgi:hypothetical protein